MDQIKTGKLIRFLRLKQNLTQLALAEKINVSDKAISKWERGCGVPDISLLPLLADALGVDVKVLLKGTLEGNDMSNGNLRKMKFYICPECGNLMFTTDDTDICCCGQKVAPLSVREAEPGHELKITGDGSEWYITSDHEMCREHYISFLAFLTGDTLILKKQYPEWGLETRLPFFAHGALFWYCTQHGLFSQKV